MSTNRSQPRIPWGPATLLGPLEFPWQPLMRGTWDQMTDSILCCGGGGGGGGVGGLGGSGEHLGRGHEFIMTPLT